MARRLVLLTLALLFVIAPASQAYASFSWVYAGGVAAWDNDSQLLAYGVQGNSLMYPKPTDHLRDWVNSLYARQDDGDFFEAGWYWRPTLAERKWFSQLRQYGVMYPEVSLNVGYKAPGTRAIIQVRRWGTSDTYRVYVDGVLVREEYLTGITSCRAAAGSERYDTEDTNRGSWTYIKWMNSSQVWSYWPNALRYIGAGHDPVYLFYNNYIDRSDHYVYCDDHQN
ncbi:MAG: hypothetical protein ACYC77_10110 [Coriobacteriia bacterium]